MLKVRGKYSVIANMINFKNLQTYNGIRKGCALVAATVILPMLAYGDHDSERWNKGDNDKHPSWGEKNQDRDKDREWFVFFKNLISINCQIFVSMNIR